MDQVKKIPKVLSKVQQIAANPKTGEDVIKFKKQINQYLNDLKSQFSTIISRYQGQITHLQMESKMLKSKIVMQQINMFSPKRSHSTNVDKNSYKSRTSSPIKNFYGTSPFNFYETTSSQMIPWPQTGQIKNISPYKTNRKSLINRNRQSIAFPQQLINPQFQNEDRLQKSRFERVSQRKKQKEQQLVHCLQMNTKNLSETTSKLLGLIGKHNTKNQYEDQQHDKQGDKNSQKSSKDKDKDQKLNQSLGNICQSLDKSFVSKKARKNKLKQKKAEEQAKKINKQRDQKNEKMRKQKGIKNLLQRLRQNANSTQPPQIVKNSKLLVTGDVSPKRTLSNVLRKNSKVLINPVPLVQNGKNSPRRRSQSPLQKRPTSILKQSSNILTRSISGISAISFVE